MRLGKENQLSEKRKDRKGRLLRKGEYQRKDGIYQYRYADALKRRHYVYAGTLETLREKEALIQRDLQDGIRTQAGRVTVGVEVERHIALKKKLRPSTRQNYERMLKYIKKCDIANMEIAKVKRSDVVAFCIAAHENGLAFGTINAHKALLYSAFSDAVDDDIIRKNPADFRLSEYLEDDTEKVVALTEEEVTSLLDFMKHSTCYSKHYDMVVFMLETGLRVSEMCGLTVSDVDLEANTVSVQRQLLRVNGKLMIEKPKTTKGARMIPLSGKAKEALNNLIRKRNKLKRRRDYIIDGYTGFIFLNTKGTPCISKDIRDVFSGLSRAYNKSHQKQLRITPHVMRHTFCTMLSNDRLSPKSIQYLMGHSSTKMLEVYDDAQFDVVQNEFLCMRKAR